MSSKPTNPKDAVGIKKIYFSVIPWGVISLIGLALLEGALKYGRHNWRSVGVRASVYYDGTLRHLSDWYEGTDIDPDSGLNHIDKALASLTVLRDSMLAGNWVDDRPPVIMEEGWQQEMNKKAAALLEKYPNPVAAHTEIDFSEDEKLLRTWTAEEHREYGALKYAGNMKEKE